MAKKLIRITDKDNVAVALSPIVKGDVLNIDNLTITATMDITAGHKIALSDIKKGEAVIKYGYPIGYAKDDIPVGSAVRKRMRPRDGCKEKHVHRTEGSKDKRL